MKVTIAYKCDHCGKISERKDYIKQHEKKCYHNPKTKSCASCRYLMFGYIENPDKPGYYDEQFQNCKKGLDVKFRQLKTNCGSHKVRPRNYDEIEYIRMFQGPFDLKPEQSGSIAG